MASRSFAAANGVLAAANRAGVGKRDFRQVPSVRALPLFKRVLERFTRSGMANHRRPWFWDDLAEPVRVLTGAARLEALLSVAPADAAVYLVVEDDERGDGGSHYWMFEGTLRGVLSTLGQHHLVEVYLMSRKLEWLIAENHHDALIGTGEFAVRALDRLGAAAGQ